MTIQLKDMAAGVLALSLIGTVHALGTEKKAKLTAEDQSDAPRDVDVTRAIRKAVTDDASLSTWAKNVQIITRQGKVTLKGAVNSQEEKNKVQALAARVAGQANVNSELTVESH